MKIVLIMGNSPIGMLAAAEKEQLDDVIQAEDTPPNETLQEAKQN